MKITRAKFESLVEDLIARSIEPCRTALKDRKQSTSDIDDVVWSEVGPVYRSTRSRQRLLRQRAAQRREP